MPAEMRTSGVNYDPRDVRPDDLSTAHLRFDVSARVGDAEVDLMGPLSVCGSGCRKQSLQLISDVNVEAEVVIVRFAKFGRSEIPGVGEFEWLVTMEDGFPLTGKLVALPGPNATAAYPASLHLGGRMVITVGFDGVEPFNLRSRVEPVLAGITPGWPPYDMRLTLTNGPIAYYREEEIDDPAAEGFLAVTSNEVQLGPEPYPLFSAPPRIESATLIADEPADAAESEPHEGVRLTWSDSAAAVTSEPPATHYHLYRSVTADDLDSWERIAELPASQTTYTDLGAPRGAQYLVTHAAELPFGYRLEGLFQDPVAVNTDLLVSA